MKNFFKNPNAIAYQKDLKISDRLVLIALIERENSLFRNGKSFYCYQESLSENTGMDRKTIRSSINRLSEKGYLTVERNYANRYRLNWDVMERDFDGFKYVTKKKEETVQEPVETADIDTEIVQDTVEEPKEAPVQAECPVEPIISSQPIDCTVEEKEAVKSPEIEYRNLEQMKVLPEIYDNDAADALERLRRTEGGSADGMVHIFVGDRIDTDMTGRRCIRRYLNDRDTAERIARTYTGHADIERAFAAVYDSVVSGKAASAEMAEPEKPSVRKDEKASAIPDIDIEAFRKAAIDMEKKELDYSKMKVSRMRALLGSLYYDREDPEFIALTDAVFIKEGGVREKDDVLSSLEEKGLMTEAVKKNINYIYLVK